MCGEVQAYTKCLTTTKNIGGAIGIAKATKCEKPLPDSTYYLAFYIWNNGQEAAGGSTHDQYIFSKFDARGFSPTKNNETCQAGENGSNPIHTALGTKLQQETDADVGDGLLLRRYYTSGKNWLGSSLGEHWRHSLDLHLTVIKNPAGLGISIWAQRANGDQLYFAVSESGAITSDSDTRLTLERRTGETGAADWSIRDQRGNLEIYDVNGRLVRVERNGSGIQRFSYVDGLLTVASNSFGRSINFSYDSAGRLISASDSNGLDIYYEFSLGGQLTRVRYQYSDGTDDIRSYSYEDPTRPYLLTGITDEDGSRYSAWAYDASGRAISSSHGGIGSEIDRVSMNYRADGTTEVTGALGEKSVYSFRAVNGVAKVTSTSAPCALCGGNFRTLTYDSNGDMDLITDFSDVVTDHDSNSRGLVVQRTEASNRSTTKRTIQTEWHTNFSAPTERRTYNASNTLVAKSTWTYNTRGQALTSTQIDPVTNATRTVATTYCEQADITAGTCPLVGLVTSVDGPRTDISDVTTYTYYPNDDATCATSPTTCPHRKGDLWKVTNALGQVTETLKYDGAGRPLSVKDPNGVITDFEYHPRGWLTARKTRGADEGAEVDDQITRIAYWPTGLVKQVTQPDGAFTAYTYDAAHRLTDIADNAGNQIHYVLDNAGNRIKEDTKDASGTLKRTLSRVYNQLGQLKTQADAQANPTDFTYDANGNTNTVTDALGRVTDNDYDPLNRLARTLQDVGGIAAETKFQYDALDNLTKVTDPKGLDTTYTYNGLGDLTQLQSPDTGTTSYTYDSAGNRQTQTDARGVTTQYGYDALNRLTTLVYPDATLNVAYTYDSVPAACGTGEGFALGRLSGMTDGSGSTQYCYDRFGNLVRKVQTTNGIAFVLRYAYTLAGQLQALIYPDGTTVDYVRDTQGRTTEVGVTRTGSPREVLLHQASYHPFGPVAGWSYGNGRQMTRSLDQDYRPLAVQDPGTGGLSLAFGFDAVGNLTQLTSGTPPPLSFVYDPLGRLTETRDGPTQAAIDTYSYDKTGNRTAHTTATGTSTYSYPTTNHRLTDVGGVIRAYDAAGNTLNIGAAKEFVYNAANRMSQVKQAGVVAMNYAYNGRGEQVRKHLGTSNTYTFYDEAGHWLGDYDNTGAPIQQALWMDDLPVGLLANNNQLHYIQPDHLGTPRVVIEVARNVPVWTWDVKGEAFGNTAPDQNPDRDANPFVFDMRFPGQRLDAVSGLNYNYFRNYDADSGRYAESDPIGLAGGIGTYVYVESRPIFGFDPFGLVGIFERCPSGTTKVCSFPYTKCTCQGPTSPAGRCGNGDCLLMDGTNPESSFKNSNLCEYDRNGNSLCYQLCMSKSREEDASINPHLGDSGDYLETIGNEYLGNLKYVKGAGTYGQAADIAISFYQQYKQSKACEKKCFNSSAGSKK
jgi:RHS repeat-associated protein